MESYTRTLILCAFKYRLQNICPRRIYYIPRAIPSTQCSETAIFRSERCGCTVETSKVSSQPRMNIMRHIQFFGWAKETQCKMDGYSWHILMRSAKICHTQYTFGIHTHVYIHWHALQRNVHIMRSFWMQLRLSLSLSPLSRLPSQLKNVAIVYLHAHTKAHCIEQRREYNGICRLCGIINNNDAPVHTETSNLFLENMRCHRCPIETWMKLPNVNL